MDAFDVLANKDAELVEQRNKVSRHLAQVLKHCVSPCLT